MENIMPNKTIYVSDDDLPLFERAQEVTGDNLSSAIVRALRRFIEIEEAKSGGLDEITVLVGGPGHLRRKRFLGVRLARWLQKNPEGKGTQVLNVYRTAKGRLALHTRTITDWGYSWGDPDYENDPKNWGVWGKLFGGATEWEAFKVSGQFNLEVFEGLEEIKPHIPEDLYKIVLDVVEDSPLEDLDI
jgi:EXLDI family protein